MAASCRRAARAILRFAGALWALPLTLPMLLLAVLAWPFGARFASQGPMLVVTHFPLGPSGALALGQVVLSRLPSLDRRVLSYRARDARRRNLAVPFRDERVHLGRHELAHVRQALVLGPLFPVAYLLSGGVHAGNRFERAADRYARTGRGWWPEW